MEYVDYETFKKMDIRVGTIREVAPVEGADKLLCCQIDCGEKNEDGSVKLRQIVSGIREFHSEFEKLIGKQVLYIVNLEPRTIRGVVSNGMLLAIDGKEGQPVFLIPEVEVNSGTKVR